MRISDWSSDVCSSDLPNPEFLIPVLLQLQILLQRPIPLERRQVVADQLAVEMIDLVLDAGRPQVVHLEHERLAVAVKRLYLDAVGAGDVGEDAGARKECFPLSAPLPGGVADRQSVVWVKRVAGRVDA